MARNIKNEKDFKLLGLTPEECRAIGFGCSDFDNHELICDNCNDLITNHKETYYVPVLNRLFCKECLKDWYKSATYYVEDSRYEALKYDTIINYLKVDNGTISISELYNNEVE